MQLVPCVLKAHRRTGRSLRCIEAGIEFQNPYCLAHLPPLGALPSLEEFEHFGLEPGACTRCVVQDRRCRGHRLCPGTCPQFDQGRCQPHAEIGVSMCRRKTGDSSADPTPIPSRQRQTRASQHRLGEDTPRLSLHGRRYRPNVFTLSGEPVGRQSRQPPHLLRGRSHQLGKQQGTEHRMIAIGPALFGVPMNKTGLTIGPLEQ